ncbi:MAG: hypothetical protein AW10_03096 [Candidatus Accumulibacter appositus]|uniref:Uncharacterized protein n=1 Tax=Candidatus Accumulibacter appositus TaxID=1454003 RepID=A0A011PMY2_9PROT|nr:MAG: hypothetical protein AW10_03096 [Candidatus Accumulibacter appositus]
MNPSRILVGSPVSTYPIREWNSSELSKFPGKHEPYTHGSPQRRHVFREQGLSESVVSSYPTRYRHAQSEPRGNFS